MRLRNVTTKLTHYRKLWATRKVDGQRSRCMTPVALTSYMRLQRLE